MDLKPLVIVLGQSGRGKSTSIRNLNPKTTVIFNTEAKVLPFKGASKFKNVAVDKPSDLIGFFTGAQEREGIEVLVVDSFSAWSDMLMEESRLKNKGYDIFNWYNDQVYKLFQILKRSKKFTILIGHDEVLNTAQGETLKRLKVEGKKWEGWCEKEAVVVLYATMESDGNGKNKYVFQTQSDGVTSAKSPLDMFKDFEIANDLKLVVDTIKAYYE